MIKLIGIDLDGTLLSNNSTITDFTKQTLNEAIKYNNLVVLATGRSYYGAVNFHEQLKLKTPLITLNGALTSFPDGTSIKHVFPKKVVENIHNDLSQYFATAIYNCEKSLYNFNRNKELEILFNGALTKDSHDFDIKKILNDDILNIVVLIHDDHKAAFESYFEGLDYDCRFWGSHEEHSFYDIYQKHVSKASALKEVLNHYNLTPDNLVTFGDGPNDLEMLTLAKDGIAMKNAIPKVKDNVKYTTDYTNEDDGVAHYLVKYFL